MNDTSYLIYGLANYVVNLRYEDISPRAVEVAKQCVLDGYGNMIYGRYCEASGKILACFEANNSFPVSEASISLLGTERIKGAKQEIIFAHTMMTRCSDLDDGYRHAMGHPGSSLVPLVFSLAELHGLTGREAIALLVAGYDIYARLGEAMNPHMYRERGFDATGICGAVAVAAMAARARGGSAKEIKDAMGLASLFTGGLIEYQNDGTSGKLFCGGWGALTGLRAAGLASQGYTGPEAALEGKKGFFQAFKGTSEHLITENVLKGLGKDFKITRIYFKRHACMRGLHATMDAVLALREAHGLTPQAIASVDVRTSNFVQRLSNPAPTTAVGGQCSVEFASAVALSHGRIDSEELVLESLRDKNVKKLAQRISVTLDDEVQRYLEENPTHFGASRVVMETTNGKRYEQWSPVPLGDEETPFGWDMLRDKFEGLILGTPFAEKGTDLYSFIYDMENRERISALLHGEI